MEPWTLKPDRGLGLSPLDRLRSPRRETGFLSSVARRLWWLTTRTYLSIWHRLTVHDPENLPKRTPFILAANHGSHLDTMALNAVLPIELVDHVFPLAAGEVFFQSPWSVAFAASFLNALPIWRKKQAGKTFQALRQRLLEESCGFILFPEGSRSRDGKMTSFKAGIGMLVAGTEVPVIPCYLSGCFESLSAGKKIPRRQTIHLTVGKSMSFDSIPDEKGGWQTIAGLLEAAIHRLQVADQRNLLHHDGDRDENHTSSSLSGNQTRCFPT